MAGDYQIGIAHVLEVRLPRTSAIPISTETLAISDFAVKPERLLHGRPQ
jgi:hypothetical protein